MPDYHVSNYTCGTGERCHLKKGIMFQTRDCYVRVSIQEVVKDHRKRYGNCLKGCPCVMCKMERVAENIIRDGFFRPCFNPVTGRRWDNGKRGKRNVTQEGD